MVPMAFNVYFPALVDPHYKPEYAQPPRVEFRVEDDEALFENPFAPCTYGWDREASVAAQKAWVEEVMEQERRYARGICPANIMPKPPRTPRKKRVKFAEQPSASSQRNAPYVFTSRGRGRQRAEDGDSIPSPKQRQARRSPEKLKAPKTSRSKP